MGQNKKRIKNDELSSLSSFPVLDVLSGWLLSNFYLSYYTFMFFIGSFFTAWYRYLDLDTKPRHKLKLLAGFFLFVAHSERTKRAPGKRKKTSTNVPHRTENLLGILFLVFSFQPLLS